MQKDELQPALSFGVTQIQNKKPNCFDIQSQPSDE